MKYKASLLLVFLFLVLLSNAQQPSMSANTGLGPGNSFTLFVTFQNPMPTVQGIGCAFNLEGALKPGQEDFVRQLRCSGTPIKDDDTHYRIKVGDFPQDIGAGDYKIQWISVAVDGDVAHQYQGSELPNLAPVAVSNPKHLEFSPIKKLEIRQ
jgi:hypothetical protein